VDRQPFGLCSWTGVVAGLHEHAPDLHSQPGTPPHIGRRSDAVSLLGSSRTRLVKSAPDPR
jgi:hypothetical protein